MNTSQPIACIVLPTFNEAKNIPIIIPKIFDQQSRISTHKLVVLVVDSASPDNTSGVVSEYQAKYANLHIICCKERGLGRAYMAGFSHAFAHFSPEFVFEMDADGQHDPTIIPTLLHLAQLSFDCVIGSRFVSGGKVINFSLWRRFLSAFGNFLIRIVGGIPKISDCTSGFRCIRTSMLQQCKFKHLLTTGYAFQSSLISELLRHGARIMEFPIQFNERHHGDSKLRWVDQFDFLLNLFFIRFNQSSQFIKYCTVGASGIVVNLGGYAFLTRYGLMDKTLAIMLSIECSIITNFIGHQLWTFNHPDTHRRSFIGRFFQYHISVLLSSFSNFIVFYFLTFGIGIWDILANFCGICVGFFINYILNINYTWKRTPPDVIHTD
jgi:dolichol-phosphate mannosyltransferase